MSSHYKASYPSDEPPTRHTSRSSGPVTGAGPAFNSRYSSLHQQQQHNYDEEGHEDIRLDNDNHCRDYAYNSEDVEVINNNNNNGDDVEIDGNNDMSSGNRYFSADYNNSGSNNRSVILTGLMMGIYRFSSSVIQTATRLFYQQRQCVQMGEGPTLIRLLCFIGGLVMLVSSIISTLNPFTLLTSPSSYLLQLYQGFFGLVTMVIEAKDWHSLDQLKPFMVEWFRFLTVPAGKGAFYLFTGSLALSLWMRNFLSFTVGLYMTAMGVICIAVHAGAQPKSVNYEEEEEEEQDEEEEGLEEEYYNEDYANHLNNEGNSSNRTAAAAATSKHWNSSSSSSSQAFNSSRDNDSSSSSSSSSSGLNRTNNYHDRSLSSSSLAYSSHSAAVVGVGGSNSHSHKVPLVRNDGLNSHGPADFTASNTGNGETTTGTSTGSSGSGGGGGRNTLSKQQQQLQRSSLDFKGLVNNGSSQYV